MPRLLQACSSVSDLFYVPVNDQAWTEFGELLQGMDDLYKTVNWIRSELEAKAADHVLLSSIANFSDQLAVKFAELNRLMDEEQFVHAGDCIRYELAEIVHAFATKLGEEQEVVDRRIAANLAYLEKHHPQAYQLLKPLSLDPSYCQVTYASNGSPNLYMRTKENKMMYLYSNYDPEHEAGLWSESMDETLAGKTNVIVYGIGFGYHLSKLSQRYPNQKWVIYEPDEQVMLAALQVVDFQELFANLKIELLIVGWNETLRHKSFFKFVKFAKGDTAVTSLPPYDRVDQQRKLEFFEDAKKAIMHFEMSSKTAAYYGIQLYQNKLYNLAHLIQSPSIRGMRDKLKGQTAVIVGAGPSLEKDIEILRQLQNHALIIAAGTAVQSLKHFGITPHLVVSLDYSEANDAAFRHLDLDDVPLLYGPQLKYTILKDKTKLMYFLPENDFTTNYYLGLEEGEPLFSSTPSVTGPAIQAAIFMGCTEIVFTGQDFSYPTEQMYATGAKHVTLEKSKAMVTAASLQVENVQGGMNRSNDMMKVTLGEIEKLLGRYPQIKFTNTSQIGAKIKHTEWKTMASVLKRLANINVPSDMVAKAMETHLSPPDDLHQQAIANRLIETPEQIIRMEATLKRIGQKLSGLQALSRVKPQKCHKTMVEIEELWESVMHSKVFEFSLVFILPNDLRTYDRDLPELVEERNVIKKADLFCKVVGTLAEAIAASLPMVGAIVKEAVNRVELNNQTIGVQ
ncbi:6-hydroxymethylpterin diphosphokinase MptE-like protein [Paenibacillus sp. R14(2021)]|uniref:motility associated factor glycosyltransferase family protein n=1 Tax=Paenibacillus sp. R14(2021) TaxID=2859228 RepID=UPI001C6140A4|nr:6-hydroxymethylpterin diphosphokinase MptE-like protein [Paenibacillus sp. R14(2021)]